MIPKLDNVTTKVTCDGVVIQWSAPDLNSNYDTDGYMIVIEALNYTSSLINNTVFEEEISLEHFEINKMYYIQISEVVCDILTNFTSLPPVVIATSKNNNSFFYVTHAALCLNFISYYSSNDGRPSTGE